MEPTILEGVDPKPLSVSYKTLSKLPRDVVRPVLGDLTFVEVLKILARNNEYLNYCIITHPTLQRFFPSVARTSEITRHFVLHHEICTFLRKPFAEVGTPSAWFLRIPVLQPREIAQILLEAIEDNLTLDTDQLDILRPYGPGPYPGPPVDRLRTLREV